MVHGAAGSANLQDRNRGTCSLSPYTGPVIIIIVRIKKKKKRNKKQEIGELACFLLTLVMIGMISLSYKIICS